MRLASCLVVALLLALPARGGELYKWTDANGVVHFADVPPPDARGVTEETRVAPRIGGPPAAAADAAARPAGDATPAAGTAPAAQADGSPARVVLTGRDEQPLGGGRLAISGEVKNQGGTPARDVAVAIRVVEPTQGDECFTDEIAVEPSTLAPGASGRFAADYENPCFHGPTNTDLHTLWDD